MRLSLEKKVSEDLVENNFFRVSGNTTVSVVRVSLRRSEHGKAVRCQVVHPALSALMDVKTFLDVQCKLFTSNKNLHEKEAVSQYLSIFCAA